MSRRRLDAEIVRRRLADSRAAARRLIEAGAVRVDGYPSPKPSTMVSPDQAINVVESSARFVSRGGEKLAAALDAFGIAVEGRRAIDVGASTGGFTDCLLQRGAASVVALDVGYGQLHWSLRTDERVIVVERTNIRKADPAELGAPFDIVVADLSFIGLGLVAPELVSLGGDATDWILLVKPQFEAGRGEVGKGGIVRDPAVRAAAVVSVAEAFAALGLRVRGIVPSPITGAKGNQEFLLWLTRGGEPLAMGDVRAVVEET